MSIDGFTNVPVRVSSEGSEGTKQKDLGQDQIITNLRDNRFSMYQMKIIGSVYGSVRRNVLLGTTNDRVVAVWNLKLRVKLWEATIQHENPLLREAQEAHVRLMDSQGTYIRIYYYLPRIAEIYFEGKKTGNIEFSKWMGNFSLENGNFLAVGGETYEDSKKIYHWNRFGELVNKIELQNPGKEIQTIANEKEYYVVTGNNVLKYDFQTCILESYDINFDASYGQLFLSDNKLFIIADGKINIFDLSSKEIINTFEIVCKDGKVSNLVGNDQKVFFLSGRVIGEVSYLESLDLTNGNQTKVMKGQIRNTSELNLTGNLLSICCHKDDKKPGNWQTWPIRMVYDIDSNNFVNATEYKIAGHPFMSFESGVLLYDYMSSLRGITVMNFSESMPSKD